MTSYSIQIALYISAAYFLALISQSANFLCPPFFMFSVTDLLGGPECLFNVGYYIKQAPMLFLLLPVYETYLI